MSAARYGGRRERRTRRSNSAAAGTWEGKRIRRTGNELIEFRRMLKTDVKNGVPVLRLQKNTGSALLTSISFECQTIFF